MMGMFVDQRAPGVVVIWEGGTGFYLRKFWVRDGEMMIYRDADAPEKRLNLRRKATPENVHAHVERIFDRLHAEEIDFQ